MPVPKSTFEAKDPDVIVPDVAVLRNTDTVFDVKLDTTRSSLPSPSTSDRATPSGPVPTVKSTFAAKDPAEMDPLLLIFLYTETAADVAFPITRSVLPSPSMSPKATPYAPLVPANVSLASKFTEPTMNALLSYLGAN